MKRVIFISTLAAVLLLAGCGQSGGKSDEPAMNHGTSHSSGNSESSGQHEGHEENGGSEEEAISNAQALFSYSNDSVQPNEDFVVKIRIQAPDGEPYDAFDTVHEKKMHLIIVSKDLSYFSHIHPDYEGGGQFSITTSLPAAGEYKWIADFKLQGGSALNRSEWMTVQGKAPALKTIVPDEQLVKTVDGKQVTLSIDHLMANMELSLNFHIADATTKKPIDNLQPYLGAVGHVVILSEDAEQYLHVHPTEEQSSGPDAVFKTTFPHSGVYKIWGQFQQDGKVFTVPFVVKVP
ncbi:hypothetical protein [Paenibacillus radicis (ex Gao et al. 2016)]|uniref:Secreted protein n=1 Tax=Paenibacillus radicis (ex Gao et al. 2016) TaxID=1737354 RepID=A0A917GZ79_9BACL|nr:hypothetical protein [Paenibacillus radicis (ex Gao et al. 2016)]GGG61363.1 hypothetical protein GCM10010918_13540 [Paenibacillus radicis (ex Gao et al. 2016)]